MASEAYRETVAGLEALHALERRGEDEGPEAEAIRDRLEPLWRAMTEEERDRARRLSADLNAMTAG